MHPIVRKMRIEDHPTVFNLWRACGLADEPEDQVGPMRDFLSAPHSAGFVAEVSGRVVGAVLCGNDGRYGYIHHLAVAEAHRKRNIGRSLVAACNEHLNSMHVAVMVRNSNPAGLSFWKCMGFSHIEGLGTHFVRRKTRTA